MATKIVMPRLSLTMKVGTVGKWYKKEGDVVEKGEAIVEIVSEKATYDLESPASGTLRKIVASEGVDAPVDTILGFITAPDEPFSEVEMSIGGSETAERAEVEQRTLASPAAKRLAREMNIDLSLVKGSGPEGRIDEEDVKRFSGEKLGFTPKVKEIIPLSGFRKISAERLSMSFRTAPHSTIMMDVDVSKAAMLHDTLQASYTAILVKAAAKALKEHPPINASLDGERIKVFADANVGVAIATKYGLVVPVVHGAGEKSLKEIDAKVRELVEKAEQGKLSREELSGGTFTITNLGMFGVDFFVPIINPPEAAILGVGRIVEKPRVISGKIEVRPVMTLSLSYDHRIVDGAPAADFLLKVKEKIEKASDLED